MATGEMDRNQAQAVERIKRARDTLEGVLLSLQIAEHPKRLLENELEYLYTCAMTPAPPRMLARSARTRATSSQESTTGAVSSVESGVSSERENSW